MAPNEGKRRTSMHSKIDNIAKLDVESNGLTAHENVHLPRVFKLLCYYQDMHKIESSMEDTAEQLKLIQKILSAPEKKDSRTVTKIKDADGKILTTEEAIISRQTQLEEKMKRHERDAEKIEKKEQKIRSCDIASVMKKLDHGGRPSFTAKEYDQMVWEVDENLDGCVGWDEFVLLYTRKHDDKTGLEPWMLFTIVQFMIYDQDCSGSVSVDETMEMLYTRYGKSNLQAKMKELFGEDMKTADGDGELSFKEYLKVVKNADDETLSTRGKTSAPVAVPAKSQKHQGKKTRSK